MAGTSDSYVIDALRARLVPPGVRLKDVPPDWRGLSWGEYLEVHWADLRREAYLVRTPPTIQNKPVSTSRDNYGWKSLPAGTPRLGGW
jgi:hypothetical protein